ncbi:hypothetical protein CVU37_02010 [candidate division BRC1 bacterium HGW-BRC1-1]|jgi:glycosyltransferase involved in cell wall biosynthesis|nr:MAG: hypothetical protein CVU37_02010 [candidate division BRC1 bacterium HGW-BRC1-1]
MTDSPLTIIHVSTETGWRGGEQQVKYLTDGLAARGHTNIVLCPPKGALHRDRREAGMAEPLKALGEWDILAASKLSGLARTSGAHLVHAHTSHAHTLTWISALQTGLPAVVSRRVDFPIRRGYFARAKYLSPVVHYISISEAVKQVLMDGGVDAGRIAIAHSGIDPGRYPFRVGPRNETEAAHWGAEPGVPLILNVAALTDHKDQQTLLRAAALLRGKLTDFKLVIAGAGELEKTLKEQAVQLGLNQHVIFAGYVQQLAPLYAAADLFVMSSHLEGLCTSILDAMLAGVPVVATRTGGIPEIVEDGKNGILVPPRTPDALAGAMASVLSQPEMAARFAEQGNATVLAGFTNDSMVEATLAAYRQIFSQPK